MRDKKEKRSLKEKIKRFLTEWMDFIILDFFEEDNNEEDD